MTASAAPAPPRTLTVLFIGGMGRSGSTLLHRLLGEQPGFAAVGELGLLWQSGLSENRLCGCGARFRECGFWQAVGDAAFGGFDALPASTLAALRRFWAHRRRFAARLLLPLGMRSRTALTEYAHHLGRLLHGVQQVSGCEVIVDASKTPAHLAALLAIRSLDVHVVHLVRDSRAVVYSWQQRRRRLDAPDREEYFAPVPAWQTGLQWMAINAALSRLRGAARSARVVRYEDFAAAPAALIEQICTQTGRRFDGAAVSAPGPGIQHTVAGNPVRLQPRPVVVKPDREWMERMSAASRWVVTACTWPGLVAYHYAMHPTVEASPPDLPEST